MTRPLTYLRLSCVTLAILTCAEFVAGQGRRGRQRSVEPGAIARVTWSEDGASVAFDNQGKRYRYELATGQRTEIEPVSGRQRPRNGVRRPSDRASTGRYVGRPRRGRQYAQVDSPNGRWEARYENWNVVLVEKESGDRIAVTIAGNEKIHYGTASWVYGEELGQNKAMWWTPDSQKLLFYRFDDSKVKTFHLVTGWTGINTEHYPEYYPKAGAENPAAELLIYDLASQKITKVQVGGSSEEYIYDVRTSPDGKVMLVNWTDRLQQKLKVYGIDLETGACRVIVEETQDTWQTNKPSMRYLADGHRFIWTTEKTGFTHYELRDLDGKLHNTITRGDFECNGIDFVDEEMGVIGFTAFSSAVNPYYLQYHVAKLDGTVEWRVSTQEYHHSNFQLSPDRLHLIAQYEEVNRPPSTALYEFGGTHKADVAAGDPSKAANLAEMFKFRSNDDRFDIYGILYKPRDFDPRRRYPVINAVYGGPGSREISPRYVSTPRAESDRGYLVVKVNNRGTGQRGKAFLGATYLRLGDIDIQDHADAIRMLRERPYVDGSRVGIVGHSYGGYMAAMGIFKHPDVYRAAVNRAGVTDWRHYDTIYTERYMSTPQLNKKGYDTGRAMQEEYVEAFKQADAKILIMHGMLDDNVHPNNAFQLIDALDRANVRYESRFFPRGGHGLGRGSTETQWEFFDRWLEPGTRVVEVSL